MTHVVTSSRMCVASIGVFDLTFDKAEKLKTVFSEQEHVLHKLVSSWVHKTCHIVQGQVFAGHCILPGMHATGAPGIYASYIYIVNLSLL